MARYASSARPRSRHEDVVKANDNPAPVDERQLIYMWCGQYQALTRSYIPDADSLKEVNKEGLSPVLDIPTQKRLNPLANLGASAKPTFNVPAFLSSSQRDTAPHQSRPPPSDLLCHRRTSPSDPVLVRFAAATKPTTNHHSHHHPTPRIPSLSTPYHRRNLLSPLCR